MGCRKRTCDQPPGGVGMAQEGSADAATAAMLCAAMVRELVEAELASVVPMG